MFPSATPLPPANCRRTHLLAAIANGTSAKLRLPLPHARRHVISEAPHFVGIGPSQEQKLADTVLTISEQRVRNFVIRAEERRRRRTKKGNGAGPQRRSEPFALQRSIECRRERHRFRLGA